MVAICCEPDEMRGRLTMENKELLSVIKYVVAGIVVAVVGMFVSDYAGRLFTGMDYGSGAVLGVCMYLCVVVVTCTGIIISKMERNAASDQSDDEMKE